MKILIVDDEQPARQRMADLLADINPDYTLLEAGNGMQALKIAEREAPQTVLMDIRMPIMDGLEAAMHMSKLSPAPVIIFVTAYDEHAIQAFEANATDYLLKPVRIERLRKGLEKADRINRSLIDRFQQSRADRKAPTHLIASSQGKIQLIPVEEIQCFRAEQKYVTVYWQGRQTLIDESLKNLEEEYSDRFLRIHRNALISSAHITALEKNANGSYQVVVEGMEEKLTVSRRHIAIIRQRLRQSG